MDINTCEKYNLEELTLDVPKKIEDIYVSNIDNFIIQTPKLIINKVSKKLTLLLNEKMENLLTEFDNKIISLISKNSEDFFEDKLTIEETEEIYKHSIKQNRNECKILLNLNKNVTIYNKHKEKLEIDTLSSNDIVICLIKCKKILFYKNYCEPLWEVFQIKVKDPEINTNKYLFIEDEKDNYVEKNDDDDDDINIKKIKIKNSK